MISTFALVVFAIFQTALLLGTSVLLVVAHRRAQHIHRSLLAGVNLLREPLRVLMMREDEGQSLAAALAGLPPDIATSLLLRMTGSRLGGEELQELAPLLRGAKWVDDVLARGSSRTWWRRMHAARLLVVVGSPRDRPLIARLLVDPHPAVASAATELIGPHGDAAIIKSVMRTLPSLPATVRQQRMRALRSHAAESTALLVPLLEQPQSDENLRVWVHLAEILGTPEALVAVVRHAWHPNPSVRATVARALRSCFLPAGIETSHVLLHDDDWTVRAAAARALGGLGATQAVADLELAMQDEFWWVRFRSALALRGLGASGEASLENAARSTDRYASDMAVVVLGLSEASRLELGA